MWLRDALPQDVPCLRLFLYGYDSKFEESQSFQDIYALGNSLRHEIRAIRNFEEVILALEVINSIRLTGK